MAAGSAVPNNRFPAMNTEAATLAEAMAAFHRGDANRALETLVEQVGAFQKPADEDWGFTAGFPRLDAFCQHLGRSLPDGRGPAGPPGPRDSALDVFIVSEIYAIGGHTALIGDYTRYRPGRAARLLVSNYLNRRNPAPPAAVARTRISPEAVEVCPVEGLAEKACWLMRRLGDLRPDRVFLLNHPEDPVPVAAAQPALARWIYFVHHADHSPALGVHLRCHGHLDVTPRAASCCREFLGVERPVYVPLGCDEPVEAWHPKVRASAAPLTTASSGSINKFSFEGPLAYPGVINTVLARTNVRHIHIGPLPRELAAGWPRDLAARGIDPARLVHICRVDSLWQAMTDFQVDLYLNSFPGPGARSSVEVMGSGTPVLLHRSPSEPLAVPMQLVYPEAAWWSTPEELVTRVREADGTWLAGQGGYARRQFERFHASAVIAPSFRHDPIAGTPGPILGSEGRALHRSRIAGFRERWLA